jgi:hypothetical protein
VVPTTVVDKVYREIVRKEMLYSSLIEFGIPMKLVMLIKICLNEHTVKSM